MKFDLKPLNRKQLERLRADVDKALERLAEVEKKEALRAAEKAARALGYSLEELTGGAVKAPKPAAKPATEKKAPAKRKAKSDGRAKVAPKFRNPNNANETWTGRGRAPKWVEAHLASGGTKEDLAI